MKIQVINKKWKVIVRSDKVHDKKFPETHAIAILEDRKIHVRRSSFNKITLLHELLHAYKSELSFYELELDDDQTDEWHCELWAKYGEQMLQDVKQTLVYHNG